MQTLLLATDGSPSADGARALAAELLHAFPTARLVAVYVQPEFPQYAVDVAVPDAWFAGEAALRETIADDLETFFADDASRVTVETRTGNAVLQICHLADEVDADLILMGSHGRGAWERTFIGSVSRGVLNHTHRPVLVAR